MFAKKKDKDKVKTNTWAERAERKSIASRLGDIIWSERMDKNLDVLDGAVAFAGISLALVLAITGFSIEAENESGEKIEQLHEDKPVSRSENLIEKINAMSEEERQELDDALENMEALLQNVDEQKVRNLFQSNEASEIKM